MTGTRLPAQGNATWSDAQAYLSSVLVTRIDAHLPQQRAYGVGRHKGAAIERDDGKRLVHVTRLLDL